MKKPMWIIRSFLITLATFLISKEAVVAQRAEQSDGSIPLLANKCLPSVEYTGLSNGAYGHFTTDSREEISIGK